MKCVAGIVMALVLAGCASHPSWVKDGATSAMTAKDLSECNRLAAVATEKDSRINQDILAARGKDWQDTGAMFIMQQTYVAQNQTQTSGIVNRCMISKGYAPGR